MKKILVTYVSYGSGHKTIAQYIANHLSKNKDYEVKIVDLIETMGNFTLKSVDAFDYIYKHRMERFFSFLYKISDNSFISKNYKVYTKKFLYNNKSKKLFLDFNPDIVLSTHWYGSNIAGYMKEKGLINPEIITVVTDYKFHKIWMTSYDKNEHFIVANEIVKKDVINNKCYSNNVYAFGLPIDIKKVQSIAPREEIIKKYKLDKNKKKILFFGGGSNSNLAYVKYLKKLLKMNDKYEILFVCGKSQYVFDKVVKLEKNYSNLKTMGFINNVYELLNVCDIVITKPGGASVTEAIEMQKYMVLLPGMGGQENYNAKFVMKNNYGIKLRGVYSFTRFMKRFFENPNRYLDTYNKKMINNTSLKQISSLIKKL